MSRRPFHAFEDHTGEVRLRVEAPTLAGLFEEAARGLSELMADAPGGAPVEAAETVTLRAPDVAALLCNWLNELVFLSETRKRVYTDVHVRSVSDTALEAGVRGVFPEVLRTAVKAATLHDLRVEKSALGYSTTIVLDV
jgi:SHS2 domain-containing protein